MFSRANLFDIFVRAPVNGTAASVVSRGDCGNDSQMDRDEVVAVIKMLEKKRRRLERLLCITTKAQRVNLTYKYSKGWWRGTVRGRHDSRAVSEWVEAGRSIQRMMARLIEMKNQNLAVTAEEG